MFIDTGTSPQDAERIQLNANLANKLRESPTITLTGDATSSVTTFDGSQNVSIPVTLSNSGVTAGSYGPTAIVNGTNGTTVNIPQITVDAKGRVTNIVNRQYTSVDNNTDINVQQTSSTTNGNFPVLFRNTASADNLTTSVCFNSGFYINPSTGADGGLHGTKVFGAVWNDYAEFREADTTEPGYVVCENGDDTLSISNKRLQPGANIVSDTFGFAIGETDTAKTPIAVSGRVLAYPYENRDMFKPGDAVCAAPGGTVSVMSREEIINYPERIIGTVSAVPTYETWGTNNVPVNGRIWIKVK